MTEETVFSDRPAELYGAVKKKKARKKKLLKKDQKKHKGVLVNKDMIKIKKKRKGIKKSPLISKLQSTLMHYLPELLGHVDIELQVPMSDER